MDSYSGLRVECRHHVLLWPLVFCCTYCEFANFGPQGTLPNIRNYVIYNHGAVAMIITIIFKVHLLFDFFFVKEVGEGTGNTSLLWIC